MMEGRSHELARSELTRRVRYERSDTEPPSIAVITALGRYYDEEPTETGVRLYEYIDPEALDALFGETYNGRTRPGGVVQFDVKEASVTVDAVSVTVAPSG